MHANSCRNIQDNSKENIRPIQKRRNTWNNERQQNLRRKRAEGWNKENRLHSSFFCGERWIWMCSVGSFSRSRILYFSLSSPLSRGNQIFVQFKKLSNEQLQIQEMDWSRDDLLDPCCNLHFLRHYLAETGYLSSLIRNRWMSNYKLKKWIDRERWFEPVRSQCFSSSASHIILPRIICSHFRHGMITCIISFVNPMVLKF